MRFVPADRLQPGMILGEDILSSNQNHMLRAGVKLTQDYIAYVKKNGYMGAYIDDEDTRDIQVHETISMQTFESSVRALRNEDFGQIFKVATEIVDEISTNHHLSVDLLDLRSYDDYTFHHSVNVAVYATVVGKKMGIKQDELTQLCQAGLCHDLGKSHIPLALLNKPGKLTDEEFETIKLHPRIAFDMLSEHPEISSFVKQAVLMHHENENGSGYPLGREGQQIPIFAKILHAVDVYDALTSKRPYKEPYSPIDAFAYLMGGSGILFDEKVVEAIISTIPAYPSGIEVVLSNGMHAIVVGHTDDPTRPVVKVLEKGERVDLSWDPRYDDIYIAEASIASVEGEIESLNENRQAVRSPKKVIIIVDDAKMSRMQTENAITGDYKFISMETGVELINYMSNHKAPDLIIMDIELPLMSGIETLKKMRAKGFMYTPVMFLTSSKSRNDIITTKDLGAIDYILKPANPIYLNERVEIALKNIREV